MLILLYHKSAEKARVIFRLRRSDIIAVAIVILKPCGFSDILFASKTRVANNTRHKPNITAKQYHSPKANKTAELPYEKFGNMTDFFVCCPAEPCIRRNGTLFSRAVLYAQLYCSQHLVARRDKSTARTGGGLQTVVQFVSSSINHL